MELNEAQIKNIGKIYKVDITDIETNDKSEMYVPANMVLDMFSHEVFSSPIQDAKTGDTITVKQNVFDKLKINY